MQPAKGRAATGEASEPARRGRPRGGMTVATIAQLAGVSPPVVSRVLNGKAGVAEETRRRVEELLREHGYRRPAMLGTTPGVEVVFHRINTYLTVEIMRGVEETLREQDMQVGFTDVRSGTRDNRSWTERMLARRPVGVITVLPHVVAEEYARLQAVGIPLVALDPNVSSDAIYPTVATTNWSGAVVATRHLLGLGHKRIGVLSGPGQWLFVRERLEACRAAMEIAGAPLDPQLVRAGPLEFDDGRRMGRELLELPDPPTALLCGNDMQALGVYTAARQVGLRIPEDLSVVGFDGIEPTLWCDPPMTTVRQPFREMGAAAANLLLTLAAGQTPAQTHLELTTTLVTRASTAPPRPTGRQPSR